MATREANEKKIVEAENTLKEVAKSLQSNFKEYESAERDQIARILKNLENLTLLKEWK